MAIEFDEVWVRRAETQLRSALSNLESRDIRKALYYIARALSNLQSGTYSSDRSDWDVYVGDKLDYAATFLDDVVDVLKEQVVTS